MFIAVISGLSSLALSHGQEYCIVFSAKTLLLQCLSPRRCIKSTGVSSNTKGL